MDFKCSGDNLEQIPAAVISETGITFPEAHTDQHSMAALASALMRHRGDVIARVPFCVTIEAEDYGAHIKLGDDKLGPRVEKYAFASVGELSSLRKIDLTKGRIREVLDAVEILAGTGKKVALSVEGPFTILSSLIDPMLFYKELRKDPVRIKEILVNVEADIIRYSLESMKRGVSIISYGDPVGAMDVVGPKVYRNFSGPSSYRIIDGIKKAGGRVLIHLCGKTSTALEKSSMARAYPLAAGVELTYGQALIGVLGKLTEPVIIGHRCIKWSTKKMGQTVLWGIELISD